MSTQIKRLRYYDGEYLRSFDFEAEQAYHLEMRRRLNMALHLYGIVSGLELSMDTEAEITQVSVKPGLAIDGYGREIFVFAPYTFGDDDITLNRIRASGTYEVWIRYLKTSETPPSAGYSNCNGGHQNTRWKESYRILLLNQGSPQGTNPQIIDPESDDPDTDRVGLRLGTVTIDFPSRTFTNPNPRDRTYVGLLAQRLVAPVFQGPDSTPTFDVLNSAKPLDQPIAIESKDNLFADQNLVVGTNFQVDPQPKPPKGQSLPSSPTGNLKIAGDLFLSGNMYAASAGKWMGLTEYVNTRFVPDIQTQLVKVMIPHSATENQATGTQLPLPVFISSSLPTVTSVQLAVSIAGVKYSDQATITKIAANPSITFSIQGAPTLVLPNSCQVQLTWNVGPTASVLPAPNSWASPITEIDVMCIIIFIP